MADDPWAAFPVVSGAAPSAPAAGGDPWAAFPVVQPGAETAQAPAQAAPQRVTPRGRMMRPGIDVPQYGREAPTSTWSDVGATANRLVTGVNEGLARSLVRPLDAAGGIINAPFTAMGAPPVDHPLERSFRRAFVPDRGPPQSTAQEIADAGGKFVGENLPIAGGVQGLAGTGVRALEKGTGTLADTIRKLVNQSLDIAAAHPKSVMAGEQLAGLEAGAGGVVGKNAAESNDFSPFWKAAAETGGQLMAPTVANYAPVSLAVRGAKAAASPLKTGAQAAAKSFGEAVPERYRPEWLDTMAKAGETERRGAANSTVRKELGAALAPPEVQGNIAEASRLQQEIPGFNPGLARSSNDQALINIEQKLDSGASGEKLRSRQAAADASRGAIEQKFEGIVPPRQNPAEAATGAARNRVAGVERGIGQQEAKAQAALAQRSQLPPSNRAAVGEDIRGAREGLKDEANTEVARLRKNIAGADTPIEISPAKPSANSADAAMGFDATPADRRSINQILDRRTEINQELRLFRQAPNKSPDDLKQARALVAEQKTLDAAVDKINAPGLKEYRDYYRDEYVPRFSEGASRDVGRYDQFGYGKSRVAGEDVAGKFFAPNNISEAKQYNKLFGNDPAARQRMTDFALDNLRTDSGVFDAATGQLHQGGIEKWMQRHSRVLDEMPWVRKEVSARNPDELYARLGQLEQRRRALSDTKLSQALGKSAAPGKTAEASIAPALNDHVLMRQLAGSVRGDAAGEGALRRAVFEQMKKEAPHAIDDPQAFLQWLDGHGRSLSHVFTTEHMNSLRNVAKAAMIQSRVPRPTGTVEMPKSIAGAIGDKTGITLPSLAASGMAIARGRTSPVSEVPMQGIKFWNKQQQRSINAAWEEALSNPNVAQALDAVMSAGKPTRMQISKLHTYLATAGIHSGEDE